MIKNKEQLINNGSTPRRCEGRRLLLEAYEAALSVVEPHKMVQSRLTLKKNSLMVHGHVLELDKFRNIFVIGAGKASGGMAEALEVLLGERISRGIVNVPHGLEHKTGRITINHAGHPVPDESGVYGARVMAELAMEASAEDLLICLISGGGSSLLPLPRGEVSLEDKRNITAALLRSGATIGEINTVRKHISAIKGGWLAEKAFPATVLNLVLSDVPGDPLDFIASGPAVADSTTFADAAGVLHRFDLFKSAPVAVQNVINLGIEGQIEDTPKAGNPVFSKVLNCIIGNNNVAVHSAAASLSAAGLQTMVLPEILEGDADEMGLKLAALAVRTADSGKRVAIIAGGETTVKLRGNGQGGRNQQMALAAAELISGVDGLVFGALSTDGVDGPTDASGAVIDGSTCARALQSGLNRKDLLWQNDSYAFFHKLNDLVITGYTGTNVNDLYIAILV